MPDSRRARRAVDPGLQPERTSVIIQNMAQIKELYKDSWETIPGNCDTILYLGGNESSTHKYVSEMLGKATIDTKTHGQTKGKSGSYSTNFQMSGRELLTPDEVRKLDNRYALLFIRGASPVMDEKYDLMHHPAISHSSLGGAAPYIHHGTNKNNFICSLVLLFYKINNLIDIVNHIIKRIFYIFSNGI